jgi:hypothetical protein
MRSDPTDTGGLFVGRRPGTRPVRYRALPPPGTRRRRAVDRTLAAVLLLAMSIICLLFWGPLPAGWLWLGSQVQYVTDSPTTGLMATFFGLLFTILIGLVVCKRIDGTWVLVRRAAGHDQREGVLARLFGATAVVALVVFAVWFLVIQGPLPSLAPA